MARAPLLFSDDSLPGRAVGSGSFVTNGASDPTDFGGDIAQVLRLTDGVNPFFRVRFRAPRDIDVAGAVLQVTARSDDPVTNHLTVNEGPVTAAPPLTRRDDEFDLVLRNAGVITDLAAQRIEFTYHVRGV